ncbi:NAD-dependent epimerase/dehydratase family protein, partial [Candidatus Pelagibacter ubique]|nr:NAD-dependent epimerase/dehydratase family protein [Candidatus Pelagibacter ubique]
PYAWSKTKNIELIKNYSQWFGLKYELVFFYNVYGPNQIIDSPMSALIGIFESQYKKKIPLTIVKPGSQRRDFTHVNDIVHGCYLAWTKGKQKEYMLCTRKTYSILEIAKMFGSKFKFLKSRPGDRFGSIVSNNNAKKILGFTAQKDIKNYIKDFISRN